VSRATLRPSLAFDAAQDHLIVTASVSVPTSSSDEPTHHRADDDADRPEDDGDSDAI
jgi:hypothetical protein